MASLLPDPIPEDASSHIGAVILAAGFGRRFGADKRVQTIDGHTIAELTTTTYRAVFDNIRVVIRPEDQQLGALLKQYDTDFVIAQDAHLGMGHSLAAGIEGLNWHWAFIGLLDMPFISPDTLRLLRQTALDDDHAAIVKPVFEPSPTEPAHPIGFHNRLFEQLAKCEGDKGARAVVHSNSQHITNVIVNDEGVIQDIDTPEDLRPTDPR